MKVKNKGIYYALSGLVLIVILIALRKCNSSDFTEVTLEKAQLRSIIETVSANGKIQPEVEVKISSEVSGEIVELPVKEGQHVNKGDLLVKINPNIYISEMEALQASLNSSKANLANAKAHLEQVESQFVNTEASFNRSKKLYDQGVVSPSDYDAAKASYEGGKADVEASKQSVSASEFNVQNSEASLRESSDKLEKTTIYSPVSGTVSRLSVEKGERVVGVSQMTGTELMRIADLNEMEANVDVNENDITRVHLNDTALVQVDAVSYTRKFKGIVTEMANSANTTGVSSDQVTNFSVKIRIMQESYKDLLSGGDVRTSPFRPGMSASVEIQTNRKDKVVTLSIQSVTTRSDTSGKKKITLPQECVFTIKDGKARSINVKTGIQDDDYIEIKEGVKINQEIISGPYTAVSKTLENGTVVKAVDKEKLLKTGD